MSRFFVTPDKVENGTVIIDSSDVGHITKALRLGIGDVIEVCDSAGTDYTAKIERMENSAVICRVLSKTQSQTEPGVFVTL